MGHMLFPRYIQREARDFFLSDVTLHLSPGAPLAPGKAAEQPPDPTAGQPARPDRGAVAHEGAPPAGFPTLSRRTWVRSTATRAQNAKMRVIRAPILGRCVRRPPRRPATPPPVARGVRARLRAARGPTGQRHANAAAHTREQRVHLRGGGRSCPQIRRSSIHTSIPSSSWTPRAACAAGSARLGGGASAEEGIGAAGGRRGVDRELAAAHTGSAFPERGGGRDERQTVGASPVASAGAGRSVRDRRGSRASSRLRSRRRRGAPRSSRGVGEAVLGSPFVRHCPSVGSGGCPAVGSGGCSAALRARAARPAR